MKVTDKELVMENRLIDKLDLMARRLKGTDDNLIIIDGDEGLGKSNMAAAICYYIAKETNRKYSVKNIFFTIDEIIKHIGETKESIIHWDEAALGGLSTQWWKQNQSKLYQLLMIARKRKHFIVMCVPKFNYLRRYFAVERSIALIHVYARQNLYKGRFFYYTKTKKESLFEEWVRKKIRMYRKHRCFGGRFPKAMEIIFTKKEQDAYDEKKDEAIMGLVTDTPSAKEDYKQERFDKLLLFTKSILKLSSRKMSEQLKNIGVPLSNTQILAVEKKFRREGVQVVIA